MIPNNSDVFYTRIILRNKDIFYRFSYLPWMKYLISMLLVVLMACNKPASILRSDVKIARDKWGVPHIHGKTDADVVYGLAWAQCEDDFVTLQEQILAAKGMLGEVKGKDGLIIDFAVKFMQLREEVENRYDAEIFGTHKELLASFVDGVNAFAVLHPGEVLLGDAFPVSDQDLLVAYLLGLVDISGAGKDLRKIMGGTIQNDIPKGSNGIAIANNKSNNGQTYLAVNSHQPLEGWYSWYEAHLVSDQGLNVLGGTFPGGFMVFHGVNENLGWAHTVNHADFSDVYQLRMHESKKHHYYFDGELLKLEKKVYWSWMKLAGFIKIPIRRTIYQSVYGPTFEVDDDFFAWRYVASRGLRASEQWFAMDKARDFSEFKKALEMQAIPSTNIVYADKSGNIYYISNGKIPKRNPEYDWQTVLPGDTSATLWTEEYYSLDSMPQVFNPAAGFVFNTNNSPFNATGPDDDPEENSLNKILGFQSDTLYNNRSLRFLQLIEKQDTVTYEEFKAIKFDGSYPASLSTPEITNLELLMNLDAHKYPELTLQIDQLKHWDRGTNIENKDAALFFFTYEALRNDLEEENRFFRGGAINESHAVNAIKMAREKMIRTYGTTEIPLGKIQRHIRGDVNLPLGGGPDVLAAMYWKAEKDGIYKGIAGESYILLADFSKEGLKIETINAYGSSAEPESPHYTDQMELYVRQQLKPMTLDIRKVFEEADTIYSPYTIVN